MLERTDEESWRLRVLCALLSGRPVGWQQSMIAGITHLTMEAGLERGVDMSLAWGFVLDFVTEVDLPGSFEKVEDSDHALPLAVLTSPDGIRLEVVQHRRQSGQVGAYTGIFRSRPPATAGPVVSRPDVESILRRAKTLANPKCVAMGTPGGEAWFESASPGAGLAGILCHANDVRAETEFWSAFARAKWSVVGADAAWGVVPSPLPQARCELVIISSDQAPHSYSMNDRGFPSIGVFSTAIERDCQKALAAGALLRSDPITASVSERMVRMALVSTPGGAPVEIMAIKAGKPQST